MGRSQYSPDVMAQASLDVARDPEIGNPSLARRVEEIIAADGEPFDLVLRALKSGREMMKRAEEIRKEQLNNGKPGVK